MGKPKPTLGTVLRAVVSLQEQVAELPTKDQMEHAIASAAGDVKEELRKEVRPISKAVDKDAVSIFKHEKRITRLEGHLSLK